MDIKFFVLIVLAFFFGEINAKTIFEKNPKNVIVSSGVNRLYPENSFPSIQFAVDNKSDYIKISLRTSLDGILYSFQDETLERTTNGKGDFSKTTSIIIDELDAGSWFSPAFINTRVPRVEDIVLRFKGKIKFYLDVKDADLYKLKEFIQNQNIEDDCFVSFSNLIESKNFRKIAPNVAQKFIFSNNTDLQEIIKNNLPQILECNSYLITDEIKNICKQNNIKLMANLLRDSWWEYKDAINKNIEMVYVDHVNYFNSMINNTGNKFSNFNLIAHRGGIVEGLYNEYDPRSIQAAIDSGYWMLEIDVRPTKDNQLIVNHDADLIRIYGISNKIDSMTLAELKLIKALKGNYSPMTFEEVLLLMKGKVKIMVDLKPSKPAPWFNKEINRLLKKHNMLDDAFFLRNDIMQYYDGGKFGFRVSEIEIIKNLMLQDKNVVDKYYLFDHGNRINAETARWCQKNNITICSSVNIDHYKMEDHYMGAKRDIEYLNKCGITIHQIDSDYDDFFINI